MATAAVIGVSTGKRLLTTSFYPSDYADKFLAAEHPSLQFAAAPSKAVIVAQQSKHFGAAATGAASSRHDRAVKAIGELVVHTPTTTSTSSGVDQDGKTEPSDLELLVLLQKTMLEKQWQLPCGRVKPAAADVTRSGVSARQRRTDVKRKAPAPPPMVRGKHSSLAFGAETPAVTRGYGTVRGTVREDLLTQSEVVQLMKKLRAGLLLEEYRSKLKKKLGAEPSNMQLAHSLRVSTAELHARMLECRLARERLVMSNVRLVISIAQKYDNFGADMADLVQGGLIGLSRGIEKFDSSKGFRVSTYVYWWIRQGVARAFMQNSRTLRLPGHLHQRLSSIRIAKTRLEVQGISPTIENIAESLRMSQKKIRNATEAVNMVHSLDREFPSLNGLPGETLHSYIADQSLENDPWHGFDEWSLKDEVQKLLCSALSKRERIIISLYHGLSTESLSWEDISRQIGLSRERVRQVGLVAMEKLKKAARQKRLEAMIVN